MSAQPTQIPGEEVIAGYQQELATTHHRALVAEAEARVLRVHLDEALTELESLRPKEDGASE
jgi:hypothetical protein